MIVDLVASQTDSYDALQRRTIRIRTNRHFQKNLLTIVENIHQNQTNAFSEHFFQIFIVSFCNL